jgi:hypothetical protein
MRQDAISGGLALQPVEVLALVGSGECVKRIRDPHAMPVEGQLLRIQVVSEDRRPSRKRNCFVTQLFMGYQLKGVRLSPVITRNAHTQAHATRVRGEMLG